MGDAGPGAGRIGVCSWSLQPGGSAELAARVSGVGVRAVQLALDPVRLGAWDLSETRQRLAEAGITLVSGMMGMAGEDYSTLDTIRATGGVRSDAHWPENREAARANASLARELELPLVTFHAGFLPEDSSDPERGTMLDRIREVADIFAREGIAVALETGQESADTLTGVLTDLQRPEVGVNFDPANMILYDMGDPVLALETLAPRVRQLHIKDARQTRVPGTWGEEVPVGAGEVRWEELFATLRRLDLRCDLVIEREAGEDRAGDIRRARELVERLRR